MKVLVIIAFCLVLSLPTLSQAQDDLTQAIKSLQQEIEATRKEIKQLRESQEKREKQRLDRIQQQAIRRNQRISVAIAAQKQQSQRQIKKKIRTEESIIDREQLIQTNETLLEQLTPVIRPEIPTKPTEQQKVMAVLILERDTLQKKIKRANKRWTCRILHIGCIGRK